MSPDELLAYLKNELDAFTVGSSNNYISMRAALCPSATGLRMFDQPLIAVGDASDPLFEELKKPDAVGQQMRLPSDWLPNAQSVISYFFPMSERVRNSNRDDGPASPEWLHARIEGQMFILRVGEHLQRLVRAAGYDVICPGCHPDMTATKYDGDPTVAYRSNWSERHVAYICGLGTFSLSRGIITEKGTAGRLGSIIVSAPLPITKRNYTELDEYCIKCGECVDRCPVNAISLENGKDNYLCHQQLQQTQELYPGYYGCGKCQVGVPCESTRP
ncbi:MAG: 4Fe-4S binding protein [Eggerthellaceae bacterium]|nr:4Fe-4S binding protein [Eggerthellaceae bacterium]